MTPTLYVATKGVRYLVRVPVGGAPKFVRLEGEGRKLRFNPGSETPLRLVGPDFAALETAFPGVSIKPVDFGLPAGIRAVALVERGDAHLDASAEVETPVDLEESEPEPEPKQKRSRAKQKAGDEV